MTYCHKCGERNREEAKYCFKCGSPLFKKEGEDKRSSRVLPSREIDRTISKIILIADDDENLGRLTHESFKNDYKALERCEKDINKLVKKSRIRGSEFNASVEDLIDKIKSRLDELNGELIALSPQLLKVTVEINRKKSKMKITTSLDKKRIKYYREKLKTVHLPTDSQEAESLMKICPVCKGETISPSIKRGILKNIKELRCSRCNSIFKMRDGKYLLYRTSDIKNSTWRLYGKKALTIEEWVRIANGGVSNEIQMKRDLEEWLKSAAE